ncbi:hypothetical protein NIES2119_13775 [[Phormidium ambiguum] IAM M-71]|uniref:Protein kinase domain-containing protein n=1 Tax=[Phormidium ambiguum] IAM M-71 TaxID=454136 RepID=A0A1U7IJJ1_9CYAN|nr:serine/threonine-protein kinase [Phormidium ambiguum]OKH37316.1 hypothetical protein NIES2119_13775 [Phormidium ambiguum IAM M-71]
MAWNRGHKLKDGKYTIREVLGEGGFGITYRVRDEKGQQFALKTLNDEVIANPNFAKLQEDFMNEGLRLAQFKNHPHIVKVYKLLQETVQINNSSKGLFGLFGAKSSSLSLCCILMEYIEGTNLAKWVEKRGAIPEAEALRYIQQVGEALIAIHQEGSLHRDVKPHNIILRASSLDAVLIDFGMVRDFSPNHSTHTMGGTPLYAAPEQFGLIPDPPKEYTDVYGLAATLFYLLTGIHPNYSVVESIKIPSASERVREAIIKGMEFRAKDRTQSVQDWLELLLGKDDLSSDKGVDYQKLRDLLKAGNWREADQETARVMLKVARREKEVWLDDKHIENFPCTDLRTIDRLWVKYSNGRFGFSVQKRIWESVGGKPGEWGGEIYNKFCDRVGWYEMKKDTWKSYDDLTFSLNAPGGHLPRCVPLAGIWRWVGPKGPSSLASRLVNCNL